MWEGLIVVGVLFIVFVGLAALVMVIRCWRKVEQGTALIITGGSKPTVHFSKAILIPLIRQAEIMDISVRRIEIFRHGSQGLVCQDNVRADIKVAFFVRVNNNEEDGIRQIHQPNGLVEQLNHSLHSQDARAQDFRARTIVTRSQAMGQSLFPIAHAISTTTPEVLFDRAQPLSWRTRTPSTSHLNTTE